MHAGRRGHRSVLDRRRRRCPSGIAGAWPSRPGARRGERDFLESLTSYFLTLLDPVSAPRVRGASGAHLAPRSGSSWSHERRSSSRSPALLSLVCRGPAFSPSERGDKVLGSQPWASSGLARRAARLTTSSATTPNT